VQLLFVDDNQTNLKVYETLARQIAGTESKTFVSSAAALTWCEQHEPDLIVLDYRMPSPNGLEFIQRFRAARPASDTPIIMVTGERDREVRHKALEYGAYDFLNKPADPVEFITRVRNMLTIRERGQRLEQNALNLADDVRRATREIADREHETITRLMRAMEFRDNDTGMHVLRMGQYAATLGRVLELSRDDQELLMLATPMHDVGKVATPDHVLLKPGPLEPGEWTVMQTHAQCGHDILAGSHSKVLQLAAIIALRHHERWDGTGYPGGLRGTDIPLGARIAAVSDVFDALISRRPYKEAWSFADAANAIRKGTGTHFDPQIVEAFEACRGEIQEIMHRFSDAGTVRA
jgi:response regulator RpfG family c-di-GMP phosphodiesterase